MAFVQGGVAEWRRVSRYRGETRASEINATDLKFLYEVNTETRKLIKRSSRANDLKEKFKMKEMSSISTLEVAWEHKSWSYWLSGTRFCSEVAQTNKLELLKWARGEKV